MFRQARKQPASHAELVEYFLDTEGEEMNFEVARCRPMITDDFMAHLSAAISACWDSTASPRLLSSHAVNIRKGISTVL